MDTHDPFTSIDTEAGVVSPSQLATLTSSSLFLNDMDEETDVFMTPADDPILICSLPQPQSEPATEAPPPEIKKGKSLVNVKKEGRGSRRKSKRIQLRSSPSSADSEEGTEAGLAAKVTPPPPPSPSAGTRMLPATLREAKRKEIAKDPSGKVGSCAENPTPVVRSPIKVEKEKDPSGKVGSCSGTPTPVVQIKKEKETIPGGKAPPCGENLTEKLRSPTKQKHVEDLSGKATPCCENSPAKEQNPMEEPEKGMGPEKAKEKEPEREKKNPLDAVYGSSTSKSLPPAAMNLLDALKLLSKPLDKTYEDTDILDICAMKGIHFDPPRWHRPGGYDRKPKPMDKGKK